MHAGWAYEDFFEGLRPVEQGGRLVFENRPGVFLNWVTEALRYQHPAARHVLVLDELNRCDTAAVLGELLQLLEYRGVTVPLLSGRPFVFPENLYLIGTMNSADRSVGRIDLALRRRFFWINLHPQPEVLARWLARPGNNPANFDAGALRAVNELLGERGVPPEQQVGHALFMGHAGRADDDAAGTGAAGGPPAVECPLTEKRLRQVVQFSVLPYVRELMRELLLSPAVYATDDVLPRVEALLLDCLTRRKSA
jgi:5-methylcytosine-specific restriction protein B